MPYNGRKHIWIREEDLPLWEAIENKPEWLHEKLNEDQEKLLTEEA